MGSPLEAVLDAVLDASDDAIVFCDKLGQILRWTAAAERLFGCSEREAVGAHLAELLAPHVRGEFDTVLARVLAGDRVRHFETEVLRHDGMPAPISLSMQEVAVPATSRVVVVVARDTTEQRLAQATLAEIQVRVNEGEALSHVGSWLWDLRTDAVQWSTEFHHIHGVDPLDFGGTIDAYLEVVDAGDRDRLRDTLQASVQGSRPLDEEYRVKLASGEVRVVHVRAQPTPGSSGSVVGLRGIGRISAPADEAADL